MTPTPATKAWECPLCFQVGKHTDRCDAKHLTKAPAAPTVHMNGTGWKDLYSQMEDAGQALNAAIDKMRDACPNGRDYYVQSPGATEIAQTEHWERICKVMAVKAELELVWMAISDQEPKRGNR